MAKSPKRLPPEFLNFLKMHNYVIKLMKFFLN